MRLPRALALPLAALLAGATTPAAVDASTADPCDWDSFGNGPRHLNAVPAGCSRIRPQTVRALKPRALYRTRDSVTGTPTVVDGTLFVGAWDGTFYAFDAESRGFGDASALTDPIESVAPRWTFKIDDTNGVSFGRIVSSAAATDPITVGTGAAAFTTRLVLFTGGSTLYVLDALDRNEDGAGDLVASLCMDPRASNRCAGGSDAQIEIEASPVVVPTEDGLRIVIGNDVHNAAGVGRTGVTAVDFDGASASLTPAWKFDPEGTSAFDPDGVTYTEGDILTAGDGTGAGCGGVWGTPAVDRDADLVVLGTASCKQPDDATASGPGEKIYGIGLSDGGFRWRYAPPRPYGSRTDDDFGSSPQLYSVGSQLIAGAGGKDGWYYALDASTGALRWASHVGQAGHTYEDFAIGGIIGTPAFGRARGRPAFFITTAISTPIGAPVDYGTLESIDESVADDPLRFASLHAVDAATGRVLWRQPLHRQSYGHPTFVNGVVFAPSTAGFNVAAYNASNGTPLWISPLNGAPSSGVAVAGDAIFLGAGTRQTDAGFKVFGQSSALPPELTALVPSLAEDLVGADPQERLAGVWSFALR